MNPLHLTRRGLMKSVCAAAALGAVHAESSNARTAWYREAKFGMFIHWGPYSQASVEASWPMMRPKAGGITQADYVALASTFNPTKFDPYAFVRLARSAGQRYMVFTTKHHDGFCMFDSRYTTYKITKAPYGKDIVAQLADACHKEGMALGFYYSPPDMHHPAFRDTSKPVSENWQGQPERPEWPLYLDYMELQLTELLTRYGPVALIWFDGLGEQSKYDGRRFLNLIHELQPATLVNNRIGVPADFETPEQFIPKAIPTRGVRISGIDPKEASNLAAGVPPAEDFRLWETCMTINGTWAYNKNDLRFKSSVMLTRDLVEIASRGGNFLLNIGPEPDGTIQPEFQDRLHAIGHWMDRNSESIYGSNYGPIQDLSFARTTTKNRDVYLHIFDWPGTQAVLPAASLPELRSVEFLASGEPVPFERDKEKLTLKLPASAPDPAVTVIALRAA